MTSRVAIIVLDQAGLECAGRIKNLMTDATIHGLSGRVSDSTGVSTDVSFEKTTVHLRQLFEQGTVIIAVCAAGIVIRALAACLTDKHTEPAVISVAGDGSVSVPLLGGHHGANRLARQIASHLGGVAAITTAGDLRLGLALDEPPVGWHVQNPSVAKTITAALLAGEDVSLCVEAGDPQWLVPIKGRFAESATDLSVTVTDRTVPEDETTLVLNPPSLVLGVGCERDTGSTELVQLVEQTLAAEGLAWQSIACVASIDLKADERAVHDLAAHFHIPARFFDPAELEQQAHRLPNPSAVVFRETGCHGVAEGAALAAVGTNGELVTEKRKSRRATCALARTKGNLNPEHVGSPRGSLAILGIGPGAEEWRTPQVTQALSMASDIVGYGLYLDLVAGAIAGKTRHESDLAQEEARARRSLELAAEGKHVALVCSGDAGIYALATLVFELLDREDNPRWNRLHISVCPGISAIQAAASRIGAPIGHDFCTISLSDLLTPWQVIRQRLEGAATGDFVVALYNPVSKKRQKHIGEARDILLQHRPAQTPVVLARNLGREGEHISVIPLNELGPDKADMLTLVLIGNSQSRLIERGGCHWVYTPRGYATKMDGITGKTTGDAA